VKTAVDTIAGTAAPPPPSPAADAAAIAQEILARDYTLNIRSCLRRGWKLLKGEFWPFVGVTALVLVLLSFASSFGGAAINHNKTRGDLEITTGTLAMLVWGPLAGGLLFYFLKKIRREPATVETAFCGLSHRFLHLFLAGFVTSLLTWLGFLCLILPGIYLLIAWMFTLPLVIDKQLDFWSAMELSRKVVTKHWFKFFGFGLVLLLLAFASMLALFIGFFVMSPLILASLMYAYEDIFGGITPVAAPPPIGAGPSGTIVMPAAAPAKPPRAAVEKWKLATQIGLAVVAVMGLVLLVFGLILPILTHRHGLYDFFAYRAMSQQRQKARPAELVDIAMPPSPPVVIDALVASIPPAVFGPVIERELLVRTAGTNNFLNLDARQLRTPPAEIVSALADPMIEHTWFTDERTWQALDIPQDSRRFQYIRWLRENGADLMFSGSGKIIGFDGIFAVAHGDSSTNWDNWDSLTPAQVRAAVDSVDWERRAFDASAHGQTMPPVPADGGSYGLAIQLDSRERGGPLVNLLTRDQSVNWFFKTRAGRMGILQIVGFATNPPAARIRYKLVQSAADQNAVAADGGSHALRDKLTARLDAAASMNDVTAKDKPLAAVAVAAANEAEVDIAKQALARMFYPAERDAAARETALLLAKRGLSKQAIEIAKGINDYTIRNQTLAELAQ
jgi:uncharacterized membrane protein